MKALLIFLALFFLAFLGLFLLYDERKKRRQYVIEGAVYVTSLLITSLVTYYVTK